MIDRRDFLCGALTATVVPQGKEGPLAGKEPLSVFPLLLLELCGKYPGEEGPQVVTHLNARRLVTVDLEDEDDWGDVNTFWTSCAS